MFIKAKRYISQMDTLQGVIHADTSKAPKQLNYHTYTLSPEASGKYFCWHFE
jgi:hypothetical protein